MTATAKPSWRQRSGSTAATLGMNLIEGVYGNQFRGDYFHGSSSHNTSSLPLDGSGAGQNEPGFYPINLTVTNHYYNLVRETYLALWGTQNHS